MLPYQASQNSFLIDAEQVSGFTLASGDPYSLPLYLISSQLLDSRKYVHEVSIVTQLHGGYCHDCNP